LFSAAADLHVSGLMESAAREQLLLKVADL
jgi:hypothetical protein